MAIGKKTGGRQKGTPNKITLDVQGKLARWKCDPFHVLAAIANGDLPCGTCYGKGRTKFQSGSSDFPGERICQSCWGSRKERITTAERSRAASDLAEYVAPKRKAVEVSGDLGLHGPGGGPLEVVFVKPSTAPGMSAPCQQCGRPAVYRRPKQQGKRVSSGHQKRLGRADHDLCERCWHKLMDAQRANDNAG